MSHRTIAVVLLALIATACTQRDAAGNGPAIDDANAAALAGAAIKPQPVQQASFEGITVPGTAIQAKALGFTDCQVLQQKDQAMVCVRHDATVFGVQSMSANVRLDKVNHLIEGASKSEASRGSLEGVKLEDLSYPYVSYQFHTSRLNPACLGTNWSRKDCFNKHSMEDLRPLFATNGWLRAEGPGDKGESYVKRDMPLRLTVVPASDITSVMLIPLPMAQANAEVDSAEQQLAHAVSKESAEKQLVEQMADGAVAPKGSAQ